MKPGALWCHPITHTRSHLSPPILQSSLWPRRLSGPTTLGNSKHVGARVGTRCSMCAGHFDLHNVVPARGGSSPRPGWSFCPSMACTSANLRPEASTHMWHTLQATAHASRQLTLIGKCIKAIRCAHFYQAVHVMNAITYK